MVKRRAAILDSGTQGPRADRGEWLGQTLLFFPDLSLSDGLSALLTRGFVDSDNAPPWDSWIGWGEDLGGDWYIASWVPDEFVRFADMAVSENPEQCLRWASGDHHPPVERGEVLAALDAHRDESARIRWESLTNWGPSQGGGRE
jgi:hypothetical protein